MSGNRNINENNSVTKRISEYIEKANFDEIPQNVIEFAKQQIADSICNMIGGQRIEASKIIMKIFEEFRGIPEATVLASGIRLPVLHAIYINSYLANSLDYDDTYLGRGFGGGGHPGSPIIPASLAIAEKLETTGKELITSVIAGYEVALRIGAAIKPSKERAKQVAPLATWQSLGATAASARLLRLDCEKTLNAFGLAGVSVPVPAGRRWGEAKDEEGPVSWVKNNYGWASMGAVLASMLASRGFLGNRQIFDGERGFWVMAGSDRCDFDKLTDGLGKNYIMLRTGIKKYPACWWAQSPIEAVEELQKENTIDVAKIRSVKVMTFHEAVHNLSKYPPAHLVDLQFSLPYLIALKLTKHSLLNVLKEDLADNQVYQIARKIDIQESKYAEESYPDKTVATVSIELENGKTLSKTVEIPKGDSLRSLDSEEFKEKFVELLEPYFDLKKAETILSDIYSLESIGNVAKMIQKWYKS